MKYRAWQVNRPDEGRAEALARSLGISRLLARTMVGRGCTDAQQAKALLQSEPMSDPFLLKDMDKAVQRIHRAVESGEPIVIFGDYDVDGITATALLYEYLRNVGAQNVRCRLPSREDEGYGLNKAVLEKLAEKGYHFIITVDNGISAVEETEYAKQLGIELVITDHHLPAERLPDAVAVVDPQREDDESPFKGLSGAGVAFKLCAALEGCSPDEMLDYCGDLAAIGTVADVMPLVGENRTLVREGLVQLQETFRPGLAALAEAAGVADREITAETISFALAPRLNAAGRMNDAALALRLLLCEDPERAQQMAEELSEKNQERQTAEQEIMQQAQQQLTAHPERIQDKVILVWGEGYHPGVIGIVASRLVEIYARPVIVIGVQNGEGRGSGRSVPGFNLHAAISSCSDILVRYGGHALAAGLTVSQQNIEQLRKRINAWAAKEYPVLPSPPVQLDVPVRLSELNVQEVAGLSALAPFGNSNPAPVFLLENVVLDGVYPVSMGRHSRLRLRQNDQTLYAAYFGMAPEQLPYEVGASLDVAISLAVFEGRGGPMLSGRIKDIRPAGLSNEAARCADLFEAFCAGVETTEQQRCELTPTREQTGTLYRLIRGGKVRCADLQPLFACTGAENAGKMLAGLTALTQLELIGEKEKNGVRYYQVLPVAQKQDLASAPILRRLRGE